MAVRDSTNPNNRKKVLPLLGANKVAKKLIKERIEQYDVSVWALANEVGVEYEDITAYLNGNIELERGMKLTDYDILHIFKLLDIQFRFTFYSPKFPAISHLVIRGNLKGKFEPYFKNKRINFKKNG